MTEQLTLFNVAPQQVIKTVHDPYWDEIVLSSGGSVEETGQVSLFYDDTQEPPDPDDYPTTQAYELAYAAWEKKYPDLVPLVKGMSDDSPSSPQSPVPSPQSLTPGDWVKINADWMNDCAAKAGKFKKDYQFQSEDDLICKVIWVASEGKQSVYVSRGNDNALYIPEGFYTVQPAPQHDTYNQVATATILPPVIPLVGAQVSTATEKTAPQHDTAQWVEKYWVERSGNKYWYYRYCWMLGRKKNRIYLGSVHSPKAQRKKQSVETAIADGQTPEEIKQMLRGCK